MSARSAHLTLRDRAVARVLPTIPRPVVRRFATPYIAGESVHDALEHVQSAARGGMTTTVDVLGEATTTVEQTEATVNEYLAVLEGLASLGDPRLVNVSLKLTALGLAFDPPRAAANVRRIVERAGELGGFVRIDMEDSPYTDQTLDLYDALRDEGQDNVGVVIQAYLKRSFADLQRLAKRKASIRVVKGIYREPQTIAYMRPQSINQSFVALCRVAAEAGCRLAIATHDDSLVRRTEHLMADLAVPKECYEYQMLLGVRPTLRDAIVKKGHPLRLYIPYGRHWYEYSLRRLQENPRVAGYVAADVVRTLVPGVARS